MLVDLDLGFALRGIDPPAVQDLDLGFALRGGPSATTLDLGLDFALEFNDNQSLAIVKVGESLVTSPLLMLVGGVLVDPVSGGEWSP